MTQFLIRTLSDLDCASEAHTFTVEAADDNEAFDFACQYVRNTYCTDEQVSVVVSRIFQKALIGGKQEREPVDQIAADEPGDWEFDINDLLASFVSGDGIRQ